MIDYLQQLEPLLISKDQVKLKQLLLEIKTSVEAYAYFTDQLKRMHFRWNRETEELCSIRDIVQKQLKEQIDDN